MINTGLTSLRIWSTQIHVLQIKSTDQDKINEKKQDVFVEQ